MKDYNDLTDIIPFFSKGATLIIKPTSICNFNCSFCSAKNMNIPIHDKIPNKLKQHIIDLKPSNIIITGGEPLVNPKSYFEDLINIMESLGNPDYNINIVSNLVLWYNNPEKFDYLFKHPNVTVDTSFQYGSDRKDDQVYTEDRFKKVFWDFYNRYGYKLPFIYVVNKDNEQYAIKAVELAKELGTKAKLNCQIPSGRATEYYPRYKLLDIYLKLIDLGLDKYESNTNDRGNYICPFPKSYKYCEINNVAFVDKNEELITGHCEEVMCSEGRLQIKPGILFSKCMVCPMFSICNGCSQNRESLEPIKEEHCKWMKDHYEQLLKNRFL